ESFPIESVILVIYQALFSGPSELKHRQSYGYLIVKFFLLEKGVIGFVFVKSNMSSKLEQPSNQTQTTAAVTSSLAIAGGSKISKFATKAGFVIPKNKLSGSLVPIFRGGKKGNGDAANEEKIKQVLRKTKWGPDLTQDTAVRNGRTLAYQTRVEQLTQQLRLRALEIEDNQGSSLASQTQDHKSLDHQLKIQELESLELERCEAIGEILKLNPSYKAPADYKPLLKEAKVPIPIKEYPAHGGVGLIFGPANDTQMRLEKETGAKVRVYGTKADTGEKVEVTTNDGNEMCGGYDELHVHVSADTYEKVDAAVALIELLVTPVSGNPASVSVTSIAISSDDENKIAPIPSIDLPSVGVNGIVESGPPLLQNHFQQYGWSWFPTVATQTPVFPSSGFAPPANHSASLISNSVQVSSSLLNPSAMPSIFGPRPVVTAGFSIVTQNPSLVHLGTQLPQVLQHPFMPQPPPLNHSGAPRNLFMPVSKPLSIQSIITLPQLSANQPTPSGAPQVVMPVLSSLPQSSFPTTFSDQPPTAAGWSKAPLSTPTSVGPGNMMLVAPSITGLHGHQSVVLQSAGAPVNHRNSVPFFNSSSNSQLGPSPSPLSAPAAAHPSHLPSSSIAPIQLGMPQLLMQNSSPNVLSGSTPLPPVTSTSTPLHPQAGIPGSGSGGAVSFNPVMTAPRPRPPNSNNFTFQPRQPQNPASEVAHRPNSRPILLHPNQPMRTPPGSQTPSIQPAMHNMKPPPNIQGFSRPNVSNQMMQPRAQKHVNFDNIPTAHPASVRHATFPSSTAVPPMQPRNFGLAPPFVNACGIPQARGAMQIQQNYPASAIRPQSFVTGNQQFNSNISFHPSTGQFSSSSGVHQVYDPFSPTSVALAHQSSSNIANMQKQESDPEYEDLMASVGVK
ncbi:hypothetical protein ACH5RR_021506, partial [Cinchona calisaya]